MPRLQVFQQRLGLGRGYAQGTGGVAQGMAGEQQPQQGALPRSQGGLGGAGGRGAGGVELCSVFRVQGLTGSMAVGAGAGRAGCHTRAVTSVTRGTAFFLTNARRPARMA